MGLLYLIVGGAAGTVSRYCLAAMVNEKAGAGFPFGTLLVNILGCLIVGILSTLGEGCLFLDTKMKMLLVTGFCGAFTTFSAVILETSSLANTGQMAKAALNITVSLALGFTAFLAGHRLGRIF